MASTSSSSSLNYPKTPRDEKATLSNTPEPVANPYVWLEDPDSAKTKAWVDAQNKLTNGFIRGGNDDEKQRETLKNQITALYNYPKISSPFFRGQYAYFWKNDGLQNQSVLFRVERQYLTQVFVDAKLDTSSTHLEEFLNPNEIEDDGTASLGARAFAKDGSKLAYGVKLSGSDWQTIYVLDTKSGKSSRDDSLSKIDTCEFVKFSGIAWTHDHVGFFYSRYPKPATVESTQKAEQAGTETDANQFQKLYYHRIGTPQSQDVLVFESEKHSQWMFQAEVSDDGEYVVLSVSESCEHVNAVYYAKLPNKAIPDQFKFTPLIDNFDAEYDYVTNTGTRFFFKTNLNAPRGKLIAIDLAECNPDDAMPPIKVLIDERGDKDVLSYIACVNQTYLVACYMHDVHDILLLFKLENGEFVRELPLPSLGTVASIRGRKEDTQIYWKFASFSYAGTVLCYDFESTSSDTTTSSSSSGSSDKNTGSISTFLHTDVKGVNPEDFICTQDWYVSKPSGVKVPVFIVHHRSLKMDGSEKHPTYLYGYGGFNISIQPYFSVSWMFWMKHFRGVLAVANIRGGGEFGETWHHQGVKENKQNVFDDFTSAARYLIEEKSVTRSNLLTIAGGSNGGLLVGACINQHPELFGAAIAHVGVMDMLQFHKFTIGHHWTSDYGCADKPDEFSYLIKYSPLHNVKINKNSPYPAVLLLTGSHDDRVVPLHSFKFAAQLQYVLGDDPKQKQPLLIRIETKAGHGAGKPTSKIIEEYVDIYQFIRKTLNLKISNQ
mmetsp:Transcript_21706/g.32211  ORF Transcript_21706/g.32211 Transcript_21706/m.32211 type:complete len:773 (-) Transcript_21706:28-2346(-)|eukprot:CAMPEP_0201546242 /NCGR_PEP_ID=MMETSP0173_2-20130828/2583_1 /ASSEMBLY_ACC=CAM_ASM_000268 /TAXON_ID=218659 /ORGANISM="Vexillifera sp., Strain DIVA3 564/2" /LENGTH=772 /DNA_ID=CAMNT_0047954849 /DNA_START=1950 /DNA_END=4268 /DNA_ORIENTATION=+